MKKEKNNITFCLKYLSKNDYANLLLLIVLTVALSFLELIGIGVLIPILFLRFLPNNNEVGGRIEKFINFFGLEYNETSINVLMITFITTLILRSGIQIVKTFIQGKILGRWRNNSESLVVYQNLKNKVDNVSSTNRNELSVRINQVTKFIDKSASSMLDLFGSSTIIFCFLVAILILVPKILIPTSISLILIILIRKIIIKKSKILEENSEFNILNLQRKSVDNIINLIKEIQVTRREIHFKSKFEKFNKQLILHNKKSRTISILPDIIVQVTFITSIGITILFSDKLLDIFSGEMLGFTIFVAIRLFPRISKFEKNMLSIYEGRKGAKILKSSIIFFESQSRNIKRIVPVLEHIELRNVKYKHKNSEITLLNGINIKINRGEFVGILGKSGQGKSTLLEIISGIRSISGGDIIVDSKPLKQNYENAFTGIGYMSQNTILLQDKLFANIAFGIDNKSINKSKVKSLLKTVELDYLIKRHQLNSNYGYVNELSTGEKQRLCLCRALYSAEDLLILDEPTSNLDKITEKRIMNTVHKYKNKLTIIMVSHNEEILDKCDSIYKIENGYLSVIR